MNLLRQLLPLILALVATHASAAEPFREPWRPQFHFTPERNWMNDPNGMVFFEGEYHLFHQYNPFGDKWGHMSWGHAVSRDLVHWEHLPIALLEENGVMIFSGSAVVDWKNTSGFGRDGRPPLVAIYTGHHTRRPLQNQHIAYSNDRGRTWTRFAGNPVLDIGETDFRDPKVIWHEPTQRWVMTIAWPVPRKVRFYASPNLKDWTHLSDFGPAGSTTGIWECPDLFTLPVEGRPGATKWVLIVSVGSGGPSGGNGVQYFVGGFDGRTFTLDGSYPQPVPESVPDGRVIADFEDTTYLGWTATGTAFGHAPARGALPNQQTVDGFRGRGLVNSYVGGDGAEGTLASPEFEVTHGHLSFLIGGGNHAGQTCVNLRIGGDVVRTATGDNAERLAWKSWDVSEFRGRKATLEIVDRHTGGWGHVNVDHILLADAPARPATAPVLWADRGPDFYAAVSWSDMPAADGRRLWIGWMSNWEYANDVPTSPWRSAMSVPRELILREAAAGLRLGQRPVRELQALRVAGQRLEDAALDRANAWLAENLPAGELLELRLEWEPAGPAGLDLVTAPGEMTSLEWTPADRRWRLDRTRSGRVDFNPRFGRVFEAPAAGDGRHVQLLLDTSSVEFVLDEGETVFTSLILPQPGSRRVVLKGGDGTRVKSLEIWPLRSIWRAGGNASR